MSREAGYERDALLSRARELEAEAEALRKRAEQLPWVCPAQIGRQRVATAHSAKQRLFSEAVAALEAAVRQWRQMNSV